MHVSSRLFEKSPIKRSPKRAGQAGATAECAAPMRGSGENRSRCYRLSYIYSDNQSTKAVTTNDVNGCSNQVSAHLDACKKTISGLELVGRFLPAAIAQVLGFALSVGCDHPEMLSAQAEEAG